MVRPAAHFDVTTILLALPALLAAWVGAQFTSERMQWTSLATLAGIALTGALAVASTTVAVWKGAGVDISDEGWLGVNHPAWAFLMIASALLAGDMLVRATTRSIRFARRLALAGLVERYVL